MHIKKGDNVIVITGKDKGKTGKVERAYPAENKILIAGVNMHKKHQRGRKQDQKGQVVDLAFPLHVSNVMIVDPKTNKRTRIGKKKVGEKMIRIAKKSGVEIK
jgi:large subunit ribosomal protein L24